MTHINSILLNGFTDELTKLAGLPVPYDKVIATAGRISLKVGKKAKIPFWEQAKRYAAKAGSKISGDEGQGVTAALALGGGALGYGSVKAEDKYMDFMYRKGYISKTEYNKYTKYNKARTVAGTLLYGAMLPIAAHQVGIMRTAPMNFRGQTINMPTYTSGPKYISQQLRAWSAKNPPLKNVKETVQGATNKVLHKIPKNEVLRDYHPDKLHSKDISPDIKESISQFYRDLISKRRK